VGRKGDGLKGMLQGGRREIVGVETGLMGARRELD